MRDGSYASNASPTPSTTSVSSRVVRLTTSSPALRVRFGRDEGSVVLLSGSAALLGANMTPNMRYTYHHADVLIEAVATHNNNNNNNNNNAAAAASTATCDARVQICGAVVAMTRSVAALRDAVAMAALHTLVHAARIDAAMASSSSSSSSLPWRGPRVLVVGADARATRALCRLLLARATRTHGALAAAAPLVAFADLDVYAQSLTCAGSVAATFAHTSSASDEALQSPPPLSFFVGHTAVTAATRKRYLDACACLAESLASVAADTPSLACGGVLLRAYSATNNDSDKDEEEGDDVSTTAAATAAGGGGAAATTTSAAAQSPSSSRSLAVADVLGEYVAMFALTHIIVAGPDVALEQAVAEATVGRRVQRLRYTLPCMTRPSRATVRASNNDEDDHDSSSSADEDDGDADKPAAATLTTTTRLRRGRGAHATTDETEMRVVPVRSLLSYFFGSTRTRLLPSRGVVALADVVLLDAVTLRVLAARDVRTRAVAAVVWADGVDTAAVANVAGYVVLLEVGERYVSLLAPAPGELPKPLLLVSPTMTLPRSCVPPLSSLSV